MSGLYDVINFNADASCLSAQDWLEAVGNDHTSLLYRWVELYVRYRKKITLGMTGATIADIAGENPAIIELINAHRDLIDIIYRPFSHDIATMRTEQGFTKNLRLGIAAANNAFPGTNPSFLPPEFMLTNQQVKILQDHGISTTFICADRFSANSLIEIPSRCYRVYGVHDSSLINIPFHGALTALYHKTVQQYDTTAWNSAIAAPEGDVFFWRDGESFLLLPEGLAREEYWLIHEAGTPPRRRIAELDLDNIPQDAGKNLLRTYPVHSFQDWMHEFRMLGFINRVYTIETGLDALTEQQQHFWLAAINSDIMAAVEKQSPVVTLSDHPGSGSPVQYRIKRSNRGFEGEEFLSMITATDGAIAAYLARELPHVRKMRNRNRFLRKIRSQDVP